MKNMIAAFGLLVSVMAFAISDSEKEALLNRNMGPVADRVQMGSLIMGGPGSVFLAKSGGTMTGTLFNQQDVRALGLLLTGKAGSGTGGRVRYFNDSGSEGWRAGFPGSVGASSFVFRDMIGSADRIEITTAGSIKYNTAGGRTVYEQDGGNTSLQTVALSGVSTLISNTTVTANSYPFPVTAGASDVAPWLIGVSAGVGYSLGATGAGTAKVVIFEGQ